MFIIQVIIVRIISEWLFQGRAGSKVATDGTVKIQSFV